MNRAFFCKQLAAWFTCVDWHYSTLLSAAIEYVSDLPDDCDYLINELLQAHTTKPTEHTIAECLYSSRRLKSWFGHGASSPSIKRINLESSTYTSLVDSRLPSINTSGDLAQWLSISPAELEWYANLWRFEPGTPTHLRHYRYELLHKRGGGIRLIEMPKSNLKRLQRQIYQQMLPGLDIHPAAHGFCRGRSSVSHAACHTGKKYLLLFDIAHCFQSIGWKSVTSVFRSMGYSYSISTYLSALCTHSVNLDRKQLCQFDNVHKELIKKRHLPQGAPTSPALANVALHRLDSRLTGLANKLGLTYSRYADDMAMSGNCHRDWRFLEPIVGHICLEEGLALNYRKTRIRRSHQKQRLVGTVVNKKINVDRQYYDALKATLTNCVRFGIDSQNHKKHPNFQAHLLGRINYVKSLNQYRGEKLEAIYKKIATL